MTKYVGFSDYRHDSDAALGILLVNLGTPDAPSTAAVRRYLAEFLSDPRVIEVPRFLWWLILHGVILRLRPARSARAYAAIWEPAGSPLLTISRRQGTALDKALQTRLGGRVEVRLAMRYGSPAIATTLHELQQAGVRRLLVLPLYPQYAASTTASVFDALSAAFKRLRWLPELRFINDYHHHQSYIEALAASVRAAWADRPRSTKLVMSFHGIPRRYLLAGDPYHCQCQATARRLAEALALKPEQWVICFQSRVGREEWLKPYTDQTLVELAAQGVGDLDVICPGFAADCLETLEEIVQQNQHSFSAAGGGKLHYIPALNATPEHINMLADLVVQHCQGWPEAQLSYCNDVAALAARRKRALALGAKQ